MSKPAIVMLKPVVILFLAITVICLIFSDQLDKLHVDHNVLLCANLLLFMLMLSTAALQLRTLHDNNPYAFIRSITLGTFIKLIVIAAAVLIYLIKAGDNKSLPAIVAAMIIYIFYTILEVRAAMNLNKNRNAKS